MSSKSEPQATEGEISLQAFAASIRSTLKLRFPVGARGVESSDIEHWLAVRWPLPRQIILCVNEWAQAYYAEYKGRREADNAASK